MLDLSIFDNSFVILIPIYISFLVVMPNYLLSNTSNSTLMVVGLQRVRRKSFLGFILDMLLKVLWRIHATDFSSTFSAPHLYSSTVILFLLCSRFEIAHLLRSPAVRMEIFNIKTNLMTIRKFKSTHYDEWAKRTKFLLAVLYGLPSRHSNSSKTLKKSEKIEIHFYGPLRTSWII